MTSQEIAEQGCILRATVGSTVHGLNIEGSDDRDEMGICIEPPEYVCGLSHFEQWVYRTKPEGVRSGPGDLDLTIYSLRKYARLAANGNPTILLLLFAPKSSLVMQTELGVTLQALAPAFISRRAGRAFLGYLTAQKERLLGERGQKRCKRPEYESAYGYDTKYAMHMLRLGYQGVELLKTGRIELPVPEPWRGWMRSIRQGGAKIDIVMTAAGKFEREMEDLLTTSPLPNEPDTERINRFLVEAYLTAWKE